MKSSLLSLLFALSLVVCPVAVATTRCVPSQYLTIQAAIDDANDGDKVVIEPGIYGGEGNYDLDFGGKAIAVSSLNPESSSCVRATIIDANGRGVVVRFVNDEGPESVFEGFTICAGDTSEKIRGVAGFFEFSLGARSTTRRLRVLSLPNQTVSRKEPPISLKVLAGKPYDGRLWRGNNPFQQPAATTDYYGSGDVDRDGQMTAADVALAQDIAVGVEPAVSRADVDGDGDVDGNDVSLLSSAISGGVLPAWWNNLSDRAQREQWVDKVVLIDQTDDHPHSYWFQCGAFSVQTHINGAFYRGDLFHAFYNRGPTMFNVPMYSVLITAPSFGHLINGILVGDDPLDFYDWRFIEPQNDAGVLPGNWDMPYGSTVSVVVPSSIQSGGFDHSGNKVSFYVDETGWSLQEYDPELVLTRPSPNAGVVNNLPDLWNPRILPTEPNIMLFFESCRDDMTRATDIYLGMLPLVDAPEGLPLVGSAQYSRLLDVSKGPDGTIHLLWKGNADYVPGVFYAELNPVTGDLSDIARVSTGTRMVRMGRVVATGTGDIHVFWLECKTNANHPYDSGIYWTRWDGSTWQAEENLTPYTDYLFHNCYWDKPDFLRYYFDTAVLEDGDIILAWAEPIFGSADANLCQRRYEGTWAPPTVLETTNVRGVELITDSAQTLHMAYWLDENEGRGTLIHRISTDGNNWSSPITVDASGSACCPRMSAGCRSQVYLVWDRKTAGQTVPVWKKYENGMWTSERELSVCADSNAWYPTVESLPSGRVAVAWSSRNKDRVTIETNMVVAIADFDHDGDVDNEDLMILCEQWLLEELSADLAPCCPDGIVNFLDWAVFANAWRSTPASPNWNPACDIAPKGGNGVVDESDLAVFCGQWLELGAYCADIAPQPEGDGTVNMFDFAIFAKHWLKNQ